MLSRRDAVALAKLLDRAERVVGEYAVDQSWRRDAMHLIGERLLEMYHDHQHTEAVELVVALRAVIESLRSSVDRADARPVRAISRARAV